MDIKEEPEDVQNNPTSAKTQLVDQQKKKEEFSVVVKTETELQRLFVTSQLPTPKNIKKENSLKKFQCPKCLRVLAKKQSFNNHLKTHIEDLECKKCGHVAKNYKSFSMHASRCRKEKFQCKICQRNFKTNARKFARHKCSFCKICGKIFTTSEAHKKHLVAIHGENSKRVRSSCDFCDYAALRKDTLAGHLLKKHVRVEKNFACDFCSEKFFSVGHMRQHMEHGTTQRAVSRLLDLRQKIQG